MLTPSLSKSGPLTNTRLLGLSDDQFNATVEFRRYDILVEIYVGREETR